MQEKHIAFLIIILSISSCVSKKKYNELSKKYEELKNSKEIVPARTFPASSPYKIVDAQVEPAIDYPKTSISFEELKKDFGSVLSTSINQHTFVFTNTGAEPLIISNVKGSCGCTVPKWPKEPIAPGETGEIKVEYKPKGQSGEQRKLVTVTANTEPVNTILTISADIEKAK